MTKNRNDSHGVAGVQRKFVFEFGSKLLVELVGIEVMVWVRVPVSVRGSTQGCSAEGGRENQQHCSRDSAFHALPPGGIVFGTTFAVGRRIAQLA